VSKISNDEYTDAGLKEQH